MGGRRSRDAATSSSSPDTAPGLRTLCVADATARMSRIGGPSWTSTPGMCRPTVPEALIAGRAGHPGSSSIQLCRSMGVPTRPGPAGVRDLAAIPAGGDDTWFSFRSGDPDGKGRMSWSGPTAAVCVRSTSTSRASSDPRLHARDGLVRRRQPVRLRVGRGRSPEAGVDAVCDRHRDGLTRRGRDRPATGGVRSQGRQRAQPGLPARHRQAPLQHPRGDVDFVSIGVPGVPGGSDHPRRSTKEQGIDYIISPDAQSALALNWGEKKT